MRLHDAPRMVVVLLLGMSQTVSVRRPPSLRQLGSDDVPTLVPSPNGSLPYRDLPAIANFMGSVGTAVQGTAGSADLFTLSAFTAPPLLACGAPGCGRVWVDGVQPRVTSTRWLPFEASRSAEQTADGVKASSQVRMQFEQPVVMWELHLDMNESDSASPTINVTIEWAAAATAAVPGAYVGWATKLPGVLPTGFSASAGPVFNGVPSVRTSAAEDAATPHVASGQQPAVTLFALFDGQTGQPPTWTFKQPDPTVNEHRQCNVSGQWGFANWPVSAEMTFVEDSHGNFTFASHYPATPWRTARGWIHDTNQVTIEYNCSSAGCLQHGSINAACNLIATGDGSFHRGFPAPPPPPGALPVAQFTLNRSVGSATLRAVMAVGHTENDCVDAISLLVAQAGKSQFDQEWGAAEQRWEDRWQAAFASNNSETSGEYSGSLPVLDVASSSPASPLDRRDTAKQKTDGESELHPLERAYYMGVLTLLLVQRNNLSMPMPAPNSSFAHAYPHQPRIYMTGLGNDVGDSVAVGLTQRWFWDSAQHAMASSLLDPVMYRANAEQILTVDLHDDTGIDLHSFVPPAQESTNERYVPPLRSQFYPDGPKPFYGFNPWSYFNTISMVQRVTNGTGAGASGQENDFLSTPRLTFAGTRSVSQILEIIATTPQKFYSMQGSNLTLYTLNPATYLEAVPTYVGAVPSVQGINVWMLRVVAMLREAEGLSERAAELRTQADALVDELLDRMYVEGRGFFRCLYNASYGVETRALHDFFYIGMGVCGWPEQRDSCRIPKQIRAEMVAWSQSECMTKDWMRAFSPNDALTYVGRADQGTTGSFSAWPAFAAHATAALQTEDSNFTLALDMMQRFAHAAREGPWGQGREVWQEPSGRAYSDEYAFKTARSTMRYVEEGGASFADTVLQAYFGFQPPVLWPHVALGDVEASQAALDAALWRPSVPRGFNATLHGVRTPLGLAMIRSSAATGLTIALELPK